MYIDRNTVFPQPSKEKATEEYEISQKFCERLGFSVVMQRPVGSCDDFKCLSGDLCGHSDCNSQQS
ncbi:MAG: hypothetical protein IKT65_00755 [Clostridia bacterium]|nr:hypothetical protein [Clostridia bacterium]